MHRLGTILGAAVLAALIPAAAAHGVVGGKTVRYSAQPWFAQVGSCGGTLVAPDRVVTSSHCVVDAEDLQFIRVGGQLRKGVRYAFPPGWEAVNADISQHDFALVQLDRPVSGVTPARLARPGEALPRRATILGKGGRKYVKGGVPSGALQKATLRPLSDAACAARFKGRLKAGNERYAAHMLCAVDPDGRKPYVSACDGDSGGALVTGTAKAPVLWGVTSWVGNDVCGTDGLPSVFAEAARYGAFVAAAAPAWGPMPGSAPRLEGTPRPGGTLTCVVDRWEVAPDSVETGWFRVRGARSTLIARQTTYTVAVADAGELLSCALRPRNGAGFIQLPGVVTRIAG